MRSIAFTLAVWTCLVATSEAGAQISVLGNTVMERAGNAGETYTGSFVVMNTSAEPQEARIYQSDYATNGEGQSLYDEPGTAARSNARWVSLGASSVIIPARSSREVTFSVTVPAGVPLKGSYWSMVMVEAVPRGAPESALAEAAPAEIQVGVTTRIRYAVQVVTHVGAEVPRQVRFQGATVAAIPEVGRALQFDLVNTGERAYAPVLSVELYAENGAHVKTLEMKRELLYPGGTLRQRFALDGLPGGKYRALVTADAGGDAVFAAQYALTL